MPAHAATTVKNDTSVPDVGGDITFAHDSGVGDDRFLTLPISLRAGGGHSIDSATYNGISLTAFGATLTQNSCSVRGFGLIAPATGSNTVAVTYGSGFGSVSTVIGASTYTGVDQSTGFENYNTAQGVDTGSPFIASVTITSATGDLAVAWAGAAQNVTWTAGSGQTERLDAARTTDGDICLTASDEAGAASVVMDHEASGLIQFVTMGVSLLAVAAAGSLVYRNPTARLAPFIGR